jgi:hypothetical protein
MIHEARIVALDGRPHVNVPRWLGQQVVAVHDVLLSHLAATFVCLTGDNTGRARMSQQADAESRVAQELHNGSCFDADPPWQSWRRFMGIRASAIVLASLLVASPPATASTLFLDTFSPQQAGWSFASPSAGFLGELNNNANVSSVTLTLASPDAGPGELSFELLGFRSLDTVYGGGDVLTLTIGGVTQFTGKWGDNPTGVGFISNPSGASFVQLYQALVFGSPAFSESTRWGFLVPVSLVAGPNTFTWSYSPLESPLENEAWGIDTVRVDAIPEPTTILLFATGLSGVVASRRRRRAPQGSRSGE